jgi:hypothetical protein
MSFAGVIACFESMAISVKGDPDGFEIVEGYVGKYKPFHFLQEWRPWCRNR